MTGQSIRRLAWRITCVTAIFGSVVAARQLVTSMDGDQVNEAIRLGQDGPAAQRLLSIYKLQSHQPSGDGPLLGQFTTPFARVVRASLKAKGSGSVLSATDVPPTLITPEVHVIVLTQQTVDGQPVIARSVSLWQRGIEVPAARLVSLTATSRGTLGEEIEGDGVVAIFPTDTFAASSHVLVHLDRVAKGGSVLSGCRDCVVPIPLRNLR
jgi:hypothetical protein